MNSWSLFLAGLLVTPQCFVAAGSAPREGRFRIVGAERALSPGESVELALAPPPPLPRQTGISWSLANPIGEQGLTALYRAPFVVAPGTPPARVASVLSGPFGRDIAYVEVELEPGSVPGAEDCLAPWQSYRTDVAGIVEEALSPGDLPELLERVDARMPEGVPGEESLSVSVELLVCRSGVVLDAETLELRRDSPPCISPLDPRVREAALVAARQFVFKPARRNGEPCAARALTVVRVVR